MTAQTTSASGRAASGTTASASTAIELVGIAKSFHSRRGVVHAVERVDLVIGEGEFFSLLGPSGCGKTTTLRMIGGFEEPTEGQILLHGRDVVGVPPNRRDVNMVFQSYALFPHMSVFENVAFGLERKSVAKGEIRQRVGDMLDLVQLEGKSDRRPKELSGGQQQRVAVARALATEPDLVFADEPTAELDHEWKDVVVGLILDAVSRGGAVVIATHDLEFAGRCDRVVHVVDGRLFSPEEHSDVSAFADPSAGVSPYADPSAGRSP
ncbi:ABC transporter ATP-binding protein, partial [Jatrophihabitans endophyticus]|uniref:ABC transporter ATP-binding protein n=1 Tax=Jatrophihabitans endophyticus TaxID=1206085 RepID=UPI001A0E3B2B